MHLKVVNVESGAILVDQDCANLSVASDVFLSLQEEEGDNEEE